MCVYNSESFSESVKQCFNRQFPIKQIDFDLQKICCVNSCGKTLLLLTNHCMSIWKLLRENGCSTQLQPAVSVFIILRAFIFLKTNCLLNLFGYKFVLRNGCIIISNSCLSRRSYHSTQQVLISPRTQNEVTRKNPWFSAVKAIFTRAAGHTVVHFFVFCLHRLWEQKVGHRFAVIFLFVSKGGSGTLATISSRWQSTDQNSRSALRTSASSRGKRYVAHVKRRHKRVWNADSVLQTP